MLARVWRRANGELRIRIALILASGNIEPCKLSFSNEQTEKRVNSAISRIALIDF